jgi:cellulose synthase/poly-beta-1,6-N-acetylglucosamine synthase-like glycosyltransferase
MWQLLIIYIFSLSGMLIIYAYALYPGIVWFLSRCYRPWRCVPTEVDALPSISLLIAAHNEEAVIGQRIENALALDYPATKLEVVVASDGSSDATNDIVRRYNDRGVRLVQYTERQGKTCVLNNTIPTLGGEVILLSDANTFYEPSAARRLAHWFSDPTVGAVCGRLILVDPKTGTNVDSLYWRYETFLKRCEGRLGGLLGANGAVYGIRKSIYRSIPHNTLVDDFVIPLYAKIATNCRIVYDPEAIAHEETPKNVRAEFRRRARIGAGGYQCLVILRRILSPRYGWTAFTFFSHKVLRWLCPFFLLTLLLSNLLLIDLPVFRWFLGGQATFYLLSVVVACLPPRITMLRPLRLTTMFASMNLALLVGFFQLLSQKQSGRWARTARVNELAASGE